MKTHYLSLHLTAEGIVGKLLRAGLFTFIFLLSLPDSSAQEIRTFNQKKNTYHRAANL